MWQRLAWEAWNIYCLALFRKSLSIPGVNGKTVKSKPSAVYFSSATKLLEVIDYKLKILVCRMFYKRC